MPRADTASDPTRKPAAGRRPVLEHIVTNAAETFLWRCDDYPWARNVWNVHPEYEIHLIRNASGVALVGDHIEHFEPGYLAIVGSGLPHDWVTATAPGEKIPGRDIVLQFDPGLVRRAAAIFPEMVEIGPFLDRALRGLAFHGATRRRGAELMEAMGAVSGLARLTLFFELLQTLAGGGEDRVLSSADFTPNTDHAIQSTVHQALTYIIANFTRPLKLADVAERLGMSEWAFSRFFQKNSGNSFTDHLVTLRLGYACKLLADTAMPVTDVCFEVGYANVSNFNRTFRSQRGMTPSAYRRLARQRITRRMSDLHGVPAHDSLLRSGGPFDQDAAPHNA